MICPRCVFFAPLCFLGPLYDDLPPLVFARLRWTPGGLPKFFFVGGGFEGIGERGREEPAGGSSKEFCASIETAVHRDGVS